MSSENIRRNYEIPLFAEIPSSINCTITTKFVTAESFKMSNLVVLFALVCTLSAERLLVVGYVRGGMESPTGSFVRVTETGDGRRQTAVSWGGFLAVEDAEASHSPGQLYVRQMTNGHDMLLLIFKGRGNLVACERSEGDAVQVAQFRQSYYNGTRKVEDGSGLSKVLDRHPEIDRSLVDWDVSKKSCVRLQEAKQHEARRLQKFVVDEVMTGHENEVKVRSRRAISLMWPGTTWCGVGNRSSNNEETEGVQVDTDRCCRQHDLCNYTIGGFSSKYSMFNFRFHTISHCECDDRSVELLTYLSS